MLATINFDHQLRFAASEVDDEGTNLRLAAEVRARQLEVVAKMLPEDALGFGWLGAHVAGEGSSAVVHGIRFHHWQRDSGTPTPDPSPQGGGELTVCVARAAIFN